jgi:hypothetical protein
MEKPLKVKSQTSTRPPPTYYDDSLMGAPPVFKKSAKYPVVNTMTTFPPPIPPHQAVGSGYPLTQQEMNRGGLAAAQSKEKPTEPEQLGIFDSLCIVMGMQSSKSQNKIEKVRQENHKRTIEDLKKAIDAIVIQKEHQLRVMERTQIYMQSTERELAYYLAQEGASKDTPVFYNFLARHSHQSQQQKDARREFALLEQREREAKTYLTNISTEEYNNQITNIILKYHNNAKSLGVEKKQIQNMRDVNKATQKQVMRQELSSALSPQISTTPDEMDISDDMQKMIARCDSMAVNIKRNFGHVKPPSPPPPPANNDDGAVLDENLLLEPKKSEKSKGEEEEDDGIIGITAARTTTTARDDGGASQQ